MSPGHKKMIWFAFDESRDILRREEKKEGEREERKGGREQVQLPAGWQIWCWEDEGISQCSLRELSLTWEDMRQQGFPAETEPIN